MKVLWIALVGYGAAALAFGVLRWAGTRLEPPAPIWKRVADCILVGITWLPQTIRAWMEL